MALPHRMGSVTAPTIRRVPPQRGQTSTSTAKPVWSTGNQSELEAGMHVLEALGDLDQLARMDRARGKGHGSS